MSGKIFLVNDARQLTPMTDTQYVNESELQTLLARYWDLLPGDQMGTDEPRRWLFIGREVGVAGGEREAEWLRLDHLFIDQDGIPTFVECKRASDTRARRAVVAQMLDYAANGTAYWTVERLRELAGATAVSHETTLSAWLAALLPSYDPDEVEAFWQRVADNLTAGRVRLIFVLDEATRELKRLVEFLNEKMEDVDLFILEVKQFKGPDGQHALVPRISGYTERGRQRTTSALMTLGGVLAALEARSVAERDIAERLHNMFVQKGAGIAMTTKGFVPRFDVNGASLYPFRVTKTGDVTVYFMYLKNVAGFASEEARHDLLRRLNAILPVPMDGNVGGKPSFPLRALSNPAAFAGFTDLVDWILGQARSCAVAPEA